MRYWLERSALWQNVSVVAIVTMAKIIRLVRSAAIKFLFTGFSEQYLAQCCSLTYG